MVERVVVIVARTQGMYEFEVQPLREYFCAKHLYVTAPYSPAGKELKGTKPDRFDAIAGNFYWLNVVRFYAGCFDKGELPTLIDRLEVLVNKNGFKYTSHPRLLASIMLSDWVFNQYPKVMQEVVSILLDGIGLRAIVSQTFYKSKSNTLSLPEGCGRAELLKRCFELLSEFPPKDLASELIALMKSNYSDDIYYIWINKLKNFKGPAVTSWLEYGCLLDILHKLSHDQLNHFFKYDFDTIKRIQILIQVNKFDYLESNDKLLTKALDAILDGKIINFMPKKVDTQTSEFYLYLYLSIRRFGDPYYYQYVHEEIFVSIVSHSEIKPFKDRRLDMKCKSFIKLVKDELENSRSWSSI